MQQTNGGSIDITAGGAAAGGAALMVIVLIELALAVLIIASMWRVFTKAGQPGWAAIIPIVNYYFLCKIAGKPGWWVILLLIPCVNIIFAIIVINGVATNFGKGVGYTLGLIFLGIIFWPMLAWGDAQYQGPATPTT